MIWLFGCPACGFVQACKDLITISGYSKYVLLDNAKLMPLKPEQITSTIGHFFKIGNAHLGVVHMSTKFRQNFRLVSGCGSISWRCQFTYLISCPCQSWHMVHYQKNFHSSPFAGSHTSITMIHSGLCGYMDISCMQEIQIIKKRRVVGV